jgi:hypothetical protein
LLRRLEGPHERVHRSGRAAAEAFLAHSTEAGWEHFRQLETASAEVLEVLDAILAAPEGS